MLNPVMEFKLLAVVLSVLFAAGLTMTRSGDKRRPQFLLALFFVYLSFQFFHLMEFFPVTAFQRYSKSGDRNARYYKMTPVLVGGQTVDGNPVKILPVLGQGRMDYFLRRVFQSSKDADLLAADYQKSYDLKMAGAGRPELLGIRYEKIKWNWRQDPYDPEKGFAVNKVTGEAPGSGNA